MSGITGIISKKKNRSFETDIDLMLGCMMHESSYSSGRYINKQAGLYVGWVSRKGSFSDCMPVWNEKRDSCLIFSGEDFTDKFILGQLKIRGHEFDTSNSSYLIHNYEEKGEEFIGDINGRFIGIILDNNKHSIVICNDRFGMQRMYYSENNGDFYFSSEAKSLIKILPEIRKLDYQGLGEFISCGCVLENRTLFSNLFLLPCGSKWTFRDGQISKKEFYYKSSDWENKGELRKEDYYNKFRDIFANILPRYFYSKEPIGISLTGGLDTRMIMSYLDHNSRQLPCYTFGGMYRESADVRIARKVASVCHQPFQVIKIRKDFFNDFSTLAERTVYITDGCLDVSGSAELYANKLAREVAPIRITGNYGSEVLRGNVAFHPTPSTENLFHPDFWNYIYNVGETYGKIRNGHPLSFIVSKQVPWHHYGRLALEESQLTVRSPFLDNDLVKLVYQAPQYAMTGADISHRIIKNGNLELDTIRTDRGIGGNSNILFLTSARILQNFMFKAEYTYDYGMPQWLAKFDNIIKHLHIEKMFLGRHKFYHFRIWYKNELSNYVREILLDRRSINRSYLEKSFIPKMVDGHLKGNYNYTILLHKTITVELIHRLFIDG